MKNKLTYTLLSVWPYFMVGILSVVLAFSVSQLVIKKSYSQNDKESISENLNSQNKGPQKNPQQSAPPLEANDSEQALTENPQKIEKDENKNDKQTAQSLVKEVADSVNQNSEDTNSTANVSEFDIFLEPYNYDPTDRRNPFQRVDQVTPENEATGVSRPLLPLENYDLSQLALIGVIWSTKNPRALIKDPTGKVHIMVKDQRLGRNQGYIADIRDGEIIVVEARDEGGDAIYTTQTLKIK